MTDEDTLTALLSIVEPSLVPAEIEVTASIDDVLGLAAPNGLEYAVVRDYEPNESRLSELNARRERLSETISTIDRIAERAEIEYALIKDCNTVRHLPRDIDLLVRESEKEQLITALTDTGYELDQEGEIETAVISEDDIPVDIYTRIQYFGVEFIDVEFLLDNTRRRTVYDTEYFGLANEGEHLLHLVHSFFGHRRITLLDFIHLLRIERDGVNDTDCLKHAAKMGWESTYLYFRSELSALERRIKDEQSVTFPYLFDLSTMIGSVNRLDADVSGYELPVLFSLWLDGIKLQIEDTPVEDAIKRIDPLRKVLLQIAYISRRMRGDRYS